MVFRRRLLFAFGFFLIMLLYLVAVFLLFEPRSSGSNIGELVIFALTFVGGSAAFALGYESVIILGGKASLRLVEFMSGLNGSKHIIEVKEEEQTNSRSFIKDTSLLYIPVSVFVISLALALNIHHFHITTDISFPQFLSSFLQNTLSVFDIFLKPTDVGSLRYSIEIIPMMVFFVAVSGVVPSIVLPYLRKFTVTSINSAPFHRDLLLTIFGLVLGLAIVLSLVDVIYEALIGNQPHYYSYALPAMVGFSLHYSLGAILGREKAEEMVDKVLKKGTYKRIIQGKISIQETKV